MTSMQLKKSREVSLVVDCTRKNIRECPVGGRVAVGHVFRFSAKGAESSLCVCRAGEKIKIRRRHARTIGGDHSGFARFQMVGVALKHLDGGSVGVCGSVVSGSECEGFMSIAHSGT